MDKTFITNFIINAWIESVLVDQFKYHHDPAYHAGVFKMAQSTMSSIEFLKQMKYLDD